MEKPLEVSDQKATQRPADTVAGFPTASAAVAGHTESLSFLAPPNSPDSLGWLGSYRVVKLLGSGGMGLVFHAEDSQLASPWFSPSGSFASQDWDSGGTTT